MDLGLQDKHVLVTGGSKGIGLACALGFVWEGARVSIAGRDHVRLDNAVRQLWEVGGEQIAHAYSVDLTDPGAAAALLDEAEADAGPIDILVNSAGAAVRTPFDELHPFAWHDAMRAKFCTYINVMDPLIKRMGKRGTGSVVNIIGMGGKLAMPTHLAGGAANAALMLASCGLAAAYGPQGVRVNAVNPSLTMTDRLLEGINTEARVQKRCSEEMLRFASSRIPLGRLADPEDIANAVLFISSPRAAYISGVTLSIDGAATPMIV